MNTLELIRQQRTKGMYHWDEPDRAIWGDATKCICPVQGPNPMHVIYALSLQCSTFLQESLCIIKAICTCLPTIWPGHRICQDTGYNVLCFIVINGGTMKKRKLVVMMTLEIRELPKQENWLPRDNIGICQAPSLPIYSQDMWTTGNFFNLLVFLSSSRSTRWPPMLLPFCIGSSLPCFYIVPFLRADRCFQ